MPETEKSPKQNRMTELVTFYIGDALCGIDILRVQEIIRYSKITWVPQAPDYVLGIINMRGRIVTVLDIGKKLGLTPVKLNKSNRNIIIDTEDEHIGLVVDRIGDIVMIVSNNLEPAPSNISGLQGEFFKGVYKKQESLIGVFSVEKILKS